MKPYEVDSIFDSSDISLKTMNGGISVYLPDIPSLSIYAKATNGKIDSDFPIYTKASGLVGEKIVKLTTMNGGISISKR
ncbi:MAG: hypothetical protein HY769_05285 [Candidatus Stahlbacteria bacterium]|nr:hypothetical protein [Candidatus Stahlbacteria bacterium]